MGSDAAEKAPRRIKPAVDADCVKALEDWLEMAKRGEIVGVVMLGNMPDSNTVHRWSGEMQLSRAMMVLEQFKLHHLLEQK